MKTIVRLSGILNLIFAAFHVFLGFWMVRMPMFSPQARVLAEMLNTALAGAFLFMGIALLVHAEEAIRTRIGRLVLLLGAVTYFIRGVEEIVMNPVPKPLILLVCLLAFVLHGTALLKSLRTANAS